jgi:hypothetical protein
VGSQKRVKPYPNISPNKHKNWSKKTTPNGYKRLGFCCFGACQNRTNRTQKRSFFAGWVQSCILRKNAKFGQNGTNETPPTLFLRVGCNLISFANKHKIWSKKHPKRIQAFGVFLFWSVPKIGKTDTKKVFFGIWVQSCILRKSTKFGQNGTYGTPPTLILRVGCNLVSFANKHKFWSKKHPKTNTIVWGFAFLECAKNGQNGHKKGLFGDLGAIVYPSQSTKFGQNVTNVTPPQRFFCGLGAIVYPSQKHKFWSKLQIWHAYNDFLKHKNWCNATNATPIQTFFWVQLYILYFDFKGCFWCFSC